MKDLALIMPVYNEEGSIENVIKIWTEELDKYDIDYNIIAYNDGSKDNTLNILKGLEIKYPHVICIDKQNSGHGSTILKGYRDCSNEYNWIFQIDSDNEMGTEGFKTLWENRENYDFLIGSRSNRVQTLTRKIISAISRLTIKIFYGQNGPKDVNSPYRLMNSKIFKNLFNTIPQETFAPNIIISGFVAYKNLRFFEYPVTCSLRQTGEVSIQKLKLLKAAYTSFKQTIAFSKKLKEL